MKKIYLYIIIATVIVGTAGYFWISNSNGNDVKYRTEKVSRGDVTLQVRATGTINPVQTVQVGSQVSGTIAKLYADFNSHVKRGQVIAQIDSTFLYASVKEARANLERIQAQVNEAKRNLTRMQELSKKDLVSQAELDAAQTAHESALAQYKQSEAALDRANVNLRYSIIHAPIDGIIISRDVDVGQTVAASLQAPKLFGIANDLKHMQVEASVDEADIGSIKEGLSATFTVDAYPEEQFRGTVTQVRLAPVTVQNVVTYTVIIEVPNPDMKLRPGMTATVSILIDKRENVLRLPTMAMRFQPPQDVIDKQKTATQPQSEEKVKNASGQSDRREDGKNRRFRERAPGDSAPPFRRMESRSEMRRTMVRAWMLEEGKNLKQVTVRSGLNDNRYVEIINGDLKEGDEVVIGFATPEIAGGPMQQTNPFQTRMPGGGGGGGRRGF